MNRIAQLTCIGTLLLAAASPAVTLAQVRTAAPRAGAKPPTKITTVPAAAKAQVTSNPKQPQQKSAPDAPAATIAKRPPKLSERLKTMRQAIEKEYQAQQDTAALTEPEPGEEPTPEEPQAGDSDAADEEEDEEVAEPEMPRELTPPPHRPTMLKNDAIENSRPVRPTPSNAAPMRRSIERAVPAPIEGLELTTAAPSIKVTTIGPRAITLGKESLYAVKLSNHGGDSAREVTVTVSIPSSARVGIPNVSAGTFSVEDRETDVHVVWTLAEVDANHEETLTLPLTATDAQGIDLQVDWEMAPVTAMTQIEVFEPKLEIEFIGPEEVLIGETAPFKLRVSNPGNGDAEGVVIELGSLGGRDGGASRKNVGTIAAGESLELDLQFAAREPGPMELSATATSTLGASASTTKPMIVRSPQLTVRAEGPKFKFAGTVATYRMNVANKGDAPARDVMAKVTIPGILKVISATDGEKLNGSTMTWKIGDLNPNEDRAIEVKCEIVADGVAKLQMVASAVGVQVVSGQVETKVESIADLKLSVEDPTGPFPVGEEVVYEVHVYNRGTKSADNVYAIASFSDGISPLRVEGGAAKIENGRVEFSPIRRIGAGEEVVLKIHARGDVAGSHVIRMEVQCESPETQLVSESTTRFFGENAGKPTTKAARSSMKKLEPTPAPKPMPPAPTPVDEPEDEPAPDEPSEDAPAGFVPSEPEPAPAPDDGYDG